MPEDAKTVFPGADSFLIPGGAEYDAKHTDEERARHHAQRADRGWSDFDFWCADTYLMHVIGSIAAKFRDDGTGYPSGMTEHEWADILTRISDPLLAYADRTSIGPEEDELHAKAREALLLFAEHFGHFWD